jgi:hypothetical protein
MCFVLCRREEFELVTKEMEQVDGTQWLKGGHSFQDKGTTIMRFRLQTCHDGVEWAPYLKQHRHATGNIGSCSAELIANGDLGAGLHGNDRDRETMHSNSHVSLSRARARVGRVSGLATRRPKDGISAGHGDHLTS